MGQSEEFAAESAKSDRLLSRNHVAEDAKSYDPFYKERTARYQAFARLRNFLQIPLRSLARLPLLT